MKLLGLEGEAGDGDIPHNRVEHNRNGAVTSKHIYISGDLPGDQMVII